MKSYVLEDNAGVISIVTYDDDYRPIWGSHYRSLARLHDAAYDWLCLIDGDDPSEWEGEDLAELTEFVDYATYNEIAETDLTDEWPSGIIFPCLGNAGWDFAEDCGVAIRCHDCGEHVAALKTEDGNFEFPSTCPTCEYQLF